MKKTLAVVLAAMMAASLTACGGGNSSDDAAKGGETQSEEKVTVNVVEPNKDAANTEKTDETLTVGLASEPSSLYGASVGKTENEEQIIGNAMLDSLVKFNYSTNEIEPSLATEWEWVDDTHLKFKLRDDVTMSDGTPLVADDVVYTCNKIWIEKNQTNDTGKYLVGATAEDEHTVVIEFNTVAPDFLKMMSWTNFGIVSEDEVNAAGGLEQISTIPLAGSGTIQIQRVEKRTVRYIGRNETTGIKIMPDITKKSIYIHK